MRTLFTLSLALFAGCSVFNGETETPTGSTAPAFRGTTQPLRVDRDVPPNELENIDVSEMRGFDRIAFEFRDRRLPGYRVQYVDNAGRLCGSNLPSEVRGQRFLRVTFQPSDSDVSDTWQRISAENIRGVRQICDRGDEVVWIVGVDEREPFRVLERQDPPRLILDVRHDTTPARRRTVSQNRP